MRLNKFVAVCGICARRAAAVLVKEGKVKVNNEVVIEPGCSSMKRMSWNTMARPFALQSISCISC
ncbi:MAG: hypothetical protein IPJ06_18120 [Saprospiraceae bacterium]|nr:hypothetical protein [Saprospiraceae bacterium]